jgi:hypothetical protein
VHVGQANGEHGKRRADDQQTHHLRAGAQAEVALAAHLDEVVEESHESRADNDTDREQATPREDRAGA